MIAVLVGLVLAGGLLPSQGASETATQFYMRYQSVVKNATSIDQVVALWAPALADEYTSAPPDQRVDLAGLKQMYGRVSNVKVTRERLVPGRTDDAMLDLEGTGAGEKKMTGTAHVFKQAGQWKLAAQEDWHGLPG